MLSKWNFNNTKVFLHATKKEKCYRIKKMVKEKNLKAIKLIANNNSSKSYDFK